MNVQLRRLALTSTDFTATLTFLTDALGVQERFVDGVRYAELDTSVGVVVLADHDLPDDSGVSLMAKVDSVDAAVELLVTKGATLVAPASDKGKESQASLTIPGSVCRLIVYGPR